MTALQEMLKDASLNVSSPLFWIKKVYFGDPVLIPASSLPALTISPKEDIFDRRGSRYDQKNHKIEIRLVYNQRDFFGAEWSDEEKVAIVADCLAKIGEVTDHSTDALTVCWLVQNNPSLSYSGWYASEDCNVVSVTYWLTSERWFATYEAVVEVMVKVIGDR